MWIRSIGAVILLIQLYLTSQIIIFIYNTSNFKKSQTQNTNVYVLLGFGGWSLELVLTIDIDKRMTDKKSRILGI